MPLVIDTGPEWLDASFDYLKEALEAQGTVGPEGLASAVNYSLTARIERRQISMAWSSIAFTSNPGDDPAKPPE